MSRVHVHAHAAQETAHPRAAAATPLEEAAPKGPASHARDGLAIASSSTVRAAPAATRSTAAKAEESPRKTFGDRVYDAIDAVENLVIVGASAGFVAGLVAFPFGASFAWPLTLGSLAIGLITSISHDRTHE